LEWRFESAGDVYPSTMHAEIMGLLHEQGAPGSDFDAAELIYGELISNVIRHAHGPIIIRLDWSSEFPTLSVTEGGHYVPPPIGLPSDPFAESGRGLFIVKTLAKDLQLIDASGRSAVCATLPVRRRDA